jgi:hypothetical protein
VRDKRQQLLLAGVLLSDAASPAFRLLHPAFELLSGLF